MKETRTLRTLSLRDASRVRHPHKQKRRKPAGEVPPLLCCSLGGLYCTTVRIDRNEKGSASRATVCVLIRTFAKRARLHCGKEIERRKSKTLLQQQASEESQEAKSRFGSSLVDRDSFRCFFRPGIGATTIRCYFAILERGSQEIFFGFIFGSALVFILR